MKLAASLVTLAVLATSTVGQTVPPFGQCGGVGYTGGTSCQTGYICQKLNDWYSQCVTPATPIPIPTLPTATSTVSPVTPTTVPVANGFVKASGTRFVLDGQKYTVVGSNSYWVGLSGHSRDNMNRAFADIAAAGGTTVRTWGFNEVTSASGIYYQSWNGKTPTVNTGATGLQNFDQVIAAAKANNIKLIVALTNNWADYGGMDVYVRQIVGANAPHDGFYTDESVKTAFKNYIRTFVGRYANETGIFGWELANEPRCRGSTANTSGRCTPATITAWAKEISAFIKSIDPNHLVALGDEGFYNQPGAPTYPYQGGEGIDFDVNLEISTLDFGTVHMYPEHWGQTGSEINWGNQWIRDHAKSQDRVRKPVILEEYGVTTNKPAVYTQWLKTIEESGLAGDLYWQAGSRLPTGNTHDDGYTVYPDQPAYSLLRTHASALKSRA
ncbi:glycoside hydrolase [Coprinopsis marcescibilis]|uniref:mannan endo-1,4-beta-mannosidase n=1 Tax=Coprinopsis marcescibilis TaxID=230819 RepID=A0A5C3KZH9_COPMA|nr:glycoside hydrolase [Coprinopsis marcescibilis]